uniref:Dishevelled associated activator of morphogenesis 1 n=1 Tax=Myotis myotis TaxID=51298 RepID=A0A7J8AJH1_MYOMY|nr:dishevelled associated activator of morphogenesis 1 [Myotis myotis]
MITQKSRIGCEMIATLHFRPWSQRYPCPLWRSWTSCSVNSWMNLTSQTNTGRPCLHFQLRKNGKYTVARKRIRKKTRERQVGLNSTLISSIPWLLENLCSH